MRIYFLLLVFLSFFSTVAIAQTSNQSTGWLFLMNNNKLTKKWGTHLDIQLRTGDQFSHLRNFMFRPGLTYFINDKSDLTLGYLLNKTYIPLIGISDIQLTEHRIWQQYIYKHKINVFNFSHRFRLEQRFIAQQNGDDVFAQRLRYFARVILPLAKNQQKFEKGAFAALQNELMFNVQHKGNVNNHFFDQNRAYVAAGYRFSKQFDLEAGYLNQAQKMRSGQTINHAIQLAVYTRF